MTSRLPFLALAIFAGCSSPERAAPDAARLTALPSPAGPRSGEPFLASDATGAVHMTWIEQTGDSTHAVRYARLDGDTWSGPTTVVERRDLFVNWADYPSLIAPSSGRLLVHWLQRSGAGNYAYDVRIAQSADRGATWTEAALGVPSSYLIDRAGVLRWRRLGTIHQSDTTLARALAEALAGGP